MQPHAVSASTPTAALHQTVSGGMVPPLQASKWPVATPSTRSRPTAGLTARRCGGAVAARPRLLASVLVPHAASAGAALAAAAAAAAAAAETNVNQGHEANGAVASSAASAAAATQPQAGSPPSVSSASSSAVASQAATPNMLLLPVAVCKTISLAPQATLADGAAELLRRLPAAAAAHGALPSGVLRLEVPLPRTATTALRWLSGQQPQQQQQQQQRQQQQHGGNSSGSPADSGPFLYFSGRRSSAPDTPGASAAEAATRGWSALAGAGAAWRWWGPGAGAAATATASASSPNVSNGVKGAKGANGSSSSGGGGRSFDSQVVSSLQRFLSADQPRVRILGGVRFDLYRAADPEWAAFGSHCFVLPLLELTEAEDCCLLAATLAWDPAAVAEATAEAGGDGAGGFVGCTNLAAAVSRAEGALRAMQPPSPDSAYGLRLTRSEPQHAPSKAEWDSHMAALLGGLQDVHDTGAPAAAALASSLDPGLARQEYLTHGQQGLDDLLAAMTMSAAASTAADRTPGEGDVGDGLDALRDLIDGKVSVSDLATAGGGSNGGAAPTSPPSAASSALRPAAALAGTASASYPFSAPSSSAAAPAVFASPTSSSDTDEELSKVVMARRTTMRLEGPLDPLHVLQSLQERDPRAYQLYFAPGNSGNISSSGHSGGHSGSTGGPGPAFLACTPERLYARSGRFVASEAVAGTRPRGRGGDVEQDFWLSLDLLRSAKDHAEFCTVRDWIAAQLAGPCEDVAVEIRKSVLKQGSVQHLFGRVAATLRRGRNDAHLLAALHPTPAVCGRPREVALGYLEELETFDRGWYAGPFGWISGAGAEFVVAIRSGLVCPETPAAATAAASLAPPAVAVAAAAAAGVVVAVPAPAAPTVTAAPPPPPASLLLQRPASLVHLYAGVGVVRGSDPAAEWQELDLKIRPMSSALMPAPLPTSAPNVNIAWAGLLVEELCRLGVNMFCVAPGSRSSPLTHAIACHPRARLNVCIDERSLGFWALGYGRAAGRPAAVVTSSGTAVANLLPAVVEASLSGVPLLLLTADRPAELRDTAANQTIDQTKIFGGFTRWFFDLPPPAPDVPGRTVLSTASTAYRAAVASAPPGPVHLNIQFREPLAPVSVPWQTGPFMQGLTQWQASQAPYTSHISGSALPSTFSGTPSASSQHLLSLHGGGGGGGGADVAALRSLLAGARRGLVVVGELIDPRDVVAARQICAALGWPVAADVLSGLRVGAPALPTQQQQPRPTPSATSASSLYDGAVPLVHHMDHLLLGDKAWWRELRPDVVLQLGPHLTSKRLGQFLDWAATGGEAEGEAGVPWVYVAPHTLRHDPSHLITHRAVMAIPDFRDAVAAPAATMAATTAAAAAAGAVERAGGSSGGGGVSVSGYGELLLQLDAAVCHEIDTSLSSLDCISEPFIARSLARSLPAGHGLFIGNSMPIRDMDMYACGQQIQIQMQTGSGSGSRSRSGSQRILGVPVAANRGASGIDGVLSTAAGFAEGLSRPSTLLVGDLSFLHDINGLNLLRGGELRPPLTVVLVNNSGGGIFSFLPIAASVPEDEFTPLWATPQNVDLEAMCRAQGIPHQKVTAPEGLAQALQAAWGLNRHSVVEVVTDRTSNVELHRVIQAAALKAAKHAHALAGLSAAAILTASSGSLAAASTACAAPSFRAGGICWQRYSLPLAQPLTTAAAATTMQSGLGSREGLLLRVQLTWPDGRLAGEGVGEVAPLPGLHTESLEEAEVQVAALSSLLEGVQVPAASLALLGGRLGAWLRHGVGLRDPTWLAPSVRFGLECALLSALAAALGTTLTDLLAPAPAPPAPAAPASNTSEPSSSRGQRRQHVRVNGLLSPPVSGDEAADTAAAVAGAVLLVAAGYTAIKVKVARRPDPEADARILAAVRAAVGPNVGLRADANRGWAGLEAAAAFGRAVADAGVGLEYVEEPTADPRDMAAFYTQTGVPVAADESLDEGLLLPSPSSRGSSSNSSSSSRTSSSSGSSLGGGSGSGRASAAAPSYSSHGLPADRAAGLAAVVVKPSVVGGLEAAVEVARWAQRRGVQVVVSSAFESSVGMAHLLQLAAAVDAGSSTSAGAATAAVHHGLGTLQWFAADVAAEPLQLTPQLLPAHSPSPAGSASAAGGAGGGSDPAAFLPLQSVCGCVDQADRLLRACAQGTGLRAQATGSFPSTSLPASSSSSGNGVHVVDPWVGGSAQGGATERELSLEVSIARPGSSGNGSITQTLRVRVRGMEALPASHRSHHSSSIQEQQQSRRQPFLFLHGFLGSGQDWLPLMRALAAAGHRCVALDLPGHGGTLPLAAVPDAASTAGSAESSSSSAATLGGGSDGGLPVTAAHTIPGAAACVVAAARQLGLEGAVVVGYSLGARVALQAVADASAAATAESSEGNGTSTAAPLWSGVVLVSGTPGIKDAGQAVARAANDDRLAASLASSGLPAFVQRWYEQPLWASLRRHPAFARMLARRTAASSSTPSSSSRPVDESPSSSSSPDAAATQAAAALSGMSTGRMVPLWDRLDPWVGPPVVLVVGDLDAKFVDINTHTLARLVRHRTAEATASAAATAAAAAAAASFPRGSSYAGRETAVAPATLPLSFWAQDQPSQRRCGAGRGGGGSRGMGVAEQLEQLGHALVRVEGAGHAVHVESPERLLGVLREAAAALEALEDGCEV